MFQIIFTISILVLPFITFGDIYEGAKVFIFWVYSFVLILYWLLYRQKEIMNVLNRWDPWYWAWIGVLIISSLAGIDPLKSLIGGGYRHQGVIFFASLWLIGKSILLLDKKHKELLTKGFVVTIIVECVLVILQRIFNISLVNFRSMGTFGEPNAVAGYINLGIFFSHNIYFVVLIFFSNLVLQSRTGVVMFLLLVSPFVFRKKIVWLLTLIVSLLIIFNFTNIRNISEDFRFEDRMLFNRIGISAIMKSPLLGYGLESGSVVFEKEFMNIGINLEGLMIDRSHNLFIDILIWSGVLGLVPFSIWLIGNLIEVYKLKNYTKLISIAAILVFGLLQPLWLVHWLMLILLINW